MPRDLFGRVDDVRDDFADAAARAAAAGFDVLVLEVSDGYLLTSCLPLLTNRRDDAHGAGPEERLRWPLEVLDAVRDRWPDDRPLAVRLNVDDRRPGGLPIDDALAIVRTLRARGVGLFDVVAGHTIPDGTAGPDYRRGFLVEHASTVRNEAQVVTSRAAASRGWTR